MIAKFGIERELENKLSVIKYENRTGDFHFHSQIELCMVIDGEIEALVNNQRRRLKKGDLSVALSYEAHMYIPMGNSTFTVLIIPPDLCREFMNNVRQQKIISPFIKSSEITEKIAYYIDEIKRSENDVLMRTGYVYLTLGLITKNVSFEERDSISDMELTSKILLYIHNYFAENITLTSVAKHFGYNPSYLSHFFKTNFNIGIKRYINIVRLNNAIQLLKENKSSITYCALESGFNSLRAFYRAFNAEFNCTPHEYMKMNLSSEK